MVTQHTSGVANLCNVSLKHYILNVLLLTACTSNLSSQLDASYVSIKPNAVMETLESFSSGVEDVLKGKYPGPAGAAVTQNHSRVETKTDLRDMTTAGA